MYDGGKVIAGLAVFLAIVTGPMWYNVLSGGETGPPELKIASESHQCVAATSYMRVFHMDMLDRWRQEAVRTTDATYVGLDGKAYEKSLTNTCLGSCHPAKDQFCDRCHQYVGAEPYCWDCHNAPGGAL